MKNLNTYEAPKASVVSFGNVEVTYTDSTQRTDGGHFGGSNLWDLPDDPSDDDDPYY